MKVLLRSDIDGVGKRGDIIDVSGGFARNHLLPAGKAIVATPGLASQAAAMRRSRDLRDARDHESSETAARALVGTPITVSARTAGERLFGSVSAADIIRQVEPVHLPERVPLSVVVEVLVCRFQHAKVAVVFRRLPDIFAE